MNLYQTKTKFNCGIDLHSKNMYLCVMDKEGNKLVHKNIKVGERVKFQEMLEHITQKTNHPIFAFVG